MTMLMTSGMLQRQFKQDISKYPLASDIQEFVNALHVLALEGFHDEGFRDVLAHKAPSIESLKPYLNYRAERYCRNLIYYDDAFEVLLLCWDKGQKSAVHGHEQSKCFMKVMQGRLQYVNYVERDPSTPADLMHDSTVIGELHDIDGSAYIHSVGHYGSAPSASLHVYAKPITECEVFDVEAKTIKRVKLVYDTMFGKFI